MQRIETWRRRCRVGLSIFYGLAGVLHIAVPGPFIVITPAWVPDASEVILVTGLCEIAGAIGLWFPSFRRYAGIGLALYAVCVFPANIKHALDSLGGTAVSPWLWLYHLIRLPLQPLIIWLAAFAGDDLTWPLHRNPDAARR